MNGSEISTIREAARLVDSSVSPTPAGELRTTIRALTVRLARAERERDAAREQVARVRQLHRQVCSGACGLPDDCECADTLTICDTCHEMWPCPTISTIDEETDRG